MTDATSNLLRAMASVLVLALEGSHTHRGNDREFVRRCNQMVEAKRKFAEEQQYYQLMGETTRLMK